MIFCSYEHGPFTFIVVQIAKSNGEGRNVLQALKYA